jgi:prepilin-type N-terminal cleavage/methylation domain-containing protein
MKTKKTQKGFTFFEVMVTVAILSIGLVIIYEALFICLNTYSYYSNSLSVQCWINKKMWEVEDKLVRGESETAVDTAGQFISGNKNIAWKMRITADSLSEKINLYRLVLNCYWREGQRDVSTSRVSYVMREEEE